jgi:hypothetical protein
MKQVVTVAKLIRAVKVVQKDQQEVQKTLQELLQFLKRLDTRAKIAVVKGRISPGRVGKVC